MELSLLWSFVQRSLSFYAIMIILNHNLLIGIIAQRRELEIRRQQTRRVDGFVRNYVGDPEADMIVPEIIRYWGYPVETHQAITADGYVLELHRIPRGRYERRRNTNTKKRIVFLQHGLLCTSSVWVMNLPHQSAAFLFADSGFDVWMGNSRGNFYSRNHLQKNIDPSKYWSFSWDEMAKFDADAMVNYVLNATDQRQLYYVGHSQGSLTMFSRLSANDGFNKKIRKFFAIAPVGTIAHVKGLFRHLGERMYDQLMLFYTFFGDQEFLPNTILSRFLTELICGLYTKNPLCENFLFLVSGPDSMQLNKTRIGIYLAHNPAGTSLRNIVHYSQMVRHGRQQAYDFGRNGNLEHYNMVIAPEYIISNITDVPIYLYYSDSDWLATSADIERHLLKWLRPQVVRGVHKVDDFNHNDFLWGLRSAEEIYRPIIAEIHSARVMALGSGAAKRRRKIVAGVSGQSESRPSLKKSETSGVADTLQEENERNDNADEARHDMEAMSFGFKTIAPHLSATDDFDLVFSSTQSKPSQDLDLISP